MANDAKKTGKRNKAAGSAWERRCVHFFKDAGYPNASTTRLESKARDDEKVDIMNKNERINGVLPVNAQCKTLAGNINIPDVLNSMPKGEDNVILFRQTKKVGERFMSRGEYAIMPIELLFRLLKLDNGK